MSDFVSILVAVVYGMTCLTNDADQGKSSPLKSAENWVKRDTRRELLADTCTKNERFQTIEAAHFVF